jgi:hypothetical protein
MEPTNKPITFNSRVPRELKMFIEMITDVFNEFEDVKWSNNSQFEIGFNYKNKKAGTEYFFGVWYDLWEHYEVPLAITFNYRGKAPVQWHDKLRSYIVAKNVEGIRVERFEEYTCILFEYNFFKFDGGDDIASLSAFYQEVTEYAEIILKR